MLYELHSPVVRVRHGDNGRRYLVEVRWLAARDRSPLPPDDLVDLNGDRQPLYTIARAAELFTADEARSLSGWLVTKGVRCVMKPVKLPLANACPDMAFDYDPRWNGMTLLEKPSLPFDVFGFYDLRRLNEDTGELEMMEPIQDAN